MCKMALLGSLCLFWIPSSAILRPGAPPRPGDPRDISGESPGREKLAFFDLNRSLLMEIYILGVRIVNILLGGRDLRVETCMLGAMDRSLLIEMYIRYVIDRLLLSEIHIWDVVHRSLP